MSWLPHLFRRPIVVNVEPVIAPPGSCVVLVLDAVIPAGRAEELAEQLKRAVPDDWRGRFLVLGAGARVAVLPPATGAPE